MKERIVDAERAIFGGDVAVSIPQSKITISEYL